MRSILGWLWSVVSAWVCWEENTRPHRRDDPAIAQYKALNRRAGCALLALITTTAVLLLWAFLGPPAGEAPYRGFTYLVHRVDQAFIALWIVSLLLTTERTYRVWRFRPDDSDR